MAAATRRKLQARSADNLLLWKTVKKTFILRKSRCHIRFQQLFSHCRLLFSWQKLVRIRSTFKFIYFKIRSNCNSKKGLKRYFNWRKLYKIIFRFCSKTDINGKTHFWDKIRPNSIMIVNLFAFKVEFRPYSHETFSHTILG